MQNIFLVEDDLNFGSVLKAYLEMNDYYVVWVNDGNKALREFKDNSFDLCILDVMLPNTDGFAIAHDIRLINKQIPLIFLTAKSLKEDVLTGYKIGADDYITKPFDSEVLLYKIKAIIARNTKNNAAASHNTEVKIGIFTFNYELRTINSPNSEQKLSPKEADLLKLLIAKTNSILSREEALKTIWGDDNYFTTRSMDVFITKLRKVLKTDTTIEIENIHGSGFRLIIKITT